MHGLLQRIALDFGDLHVRIASEGTEGIFDQTQSECFSSFMQQQRVSIFEKKKKIPTFHTMYEDGLITDQTLLIKYLRFVFLKAGVTHYPLMRLEVYMVVPTTTSQVTKQLWVDTLESLGVSTVVFCTNALSSAVGAGFSFPVPNFALLVHLGHSYSEIAGIALTRSLFSKPLEFCGVTITSVLESEVFRVYGKELTASFWNTLLSEIGSFLPTHTVAPLRPEQKALFDEIVTTEQIPIEFLIEKIGKIMVTTATQLQLALEQLSPDELASCTKNGIVLTGGLACSEGVASYLSSILSMPVYPSADPDLASIRGTVTLLHELTEDERMWKLS